MDGRGVGCGPFKITLSYGYRLRSMPGGTQPAVDPFQLRSAAGGAKQHMAALASAASLRPRRASATFHSLPEEQTRTHKHSRERGILILTQPRSADCCPSSAPQYERSKTIEGALLRPRHRCWGTYPPNSAKSGPGPRRWHGLANNTPSSLLGHNNLFHIQRGRRSLLSETHRPRPREERAGQVKSTGKPPEDTADAGGDGRRRRWHRRVATLQAGGPGA